MVSGHSHVDSCPRGWITYGSSCYSFVGHRPSSWQDSLNICNASLSAHLVSVNTLEEGVFLAKWLEDNDFRRKVPLDPLFGNCLMYVCPGDFQSWWTSGYLINERWEWAGDGTKISFYAKGARLNSNGGSSKIAYAWRDDEFLW